jgi:two-component system, NarL family, sensor kinase
VEGQDQERNRIAKEIHDGVGGELAGIKLNLSQINLTVKNEKITTILNQLSGLFQELRNISHNLSSNFIKNKDFTEVLLELKTEYDHRNEFETELTVFPKNAFEKTDENTKHQIYRIIQELLTNISKHAMAKNVSITITKHDDIMNIIIEDDGKGFEENSQNGIGLKNIQERIETLNGKLVLETTPKKGSTFILDIPN